MAPNRESLHRAGSTLLRRAARRAGYDVVRADYYSPIVDTAAVPPHVWERPSPMPGLELDLDRQLEHIEQHLCPHLAAFDPGDRLENPMYGPMDAHVLYATVRDAQPRQILELGSGYSTLIIEQALSDSAATHARHIVVDPHPSPLLVSLRRPLDLRAQSAATIDNYTFERLEQRDILFVDTSHVVRPGGEVVRIVLEVLPTLRPGVIVHFHDFFRPFEYPRVLYDAYHVHWQEQYLVQALLAHNPQFEVLCANHALWRLRRERVQTLFGGLRAGIEPSALWIIRRDA